MFCLLGNGTLLNWLIQWQIKDNPPGELKGAYVQNLSV